VPLSTGLLAVACGLALLVPAESGGAERGGAAPATVVSLVPYADGVAADLLRPARVADGAPVVVLVHGCCGDRRDMAGVARALARRGAVVLNADVRTVAAGGGWPASYHEVACAVRTARTVGSGLGGGRHPVALVGWSEGALLAATVTLGWPSIEPAAHAACPGLSMPQGPDVLVGLGGYYGWDGPVPADLVTDATVAWFGAAPAEDPGAWQQGNPRWWLEITGGASAGAGAVPPVRLVATPGDAHAATFQSALAARGVDAAVATIAGATHLGLIQPRDVAGAAALAALCDALGLARSPVGN
jgi:acetyl esterase/lipase